jgi:phosphate transport system substrate-binding protein
VAGIRSAFLTRLLRPKRLGGVALALALPLPMAACGGSSSATTASTGALLGSGSTLLAPLMSKWQSGFDRRARGFTVTYAAIGSGGGIHDITKRSVDFGASDAPLSPDEFSAAAGVEQIPWALSATVAAYNVRGAPRNLKLSGPVLADIYLGTITKWNDQAIAKLNPDANLPATVITPIHRSGESGDTYAFTNYLSSVSPEFRSKVGASTRVDFPAGSGAEQNDGVSAAIAEQDGTIGYVSLAYALQNHLDVAAVENSAGAFPTPRVASVAAAADAIDRINPDNSIPLVDLPASAKNAYPVSTYTYVIVPLNSSRPSELKRFISYAISKPAQAFGPRFGFAPLPKATSAADRKALRELGS